MAEVNLEMRYRISTPYSPVTMIVICGSGFVFVGMASLWLALKGDDPMGFGFIGLLLSTIGVSLLWWSIGQLRRFRLRLFEDDSIEYTDWGRQTSHHVVHDVTFSKGYGSYGYLPEPLFKGPITGYNIALKDARVIHFEPPLPADLHDALVRAGKLKAMF